jgi:hypothetical protein
MHTAQAGDLVEHLGHYNRRRCFRKHLSRVLAVFVATTVGCQGEDAVEWSARMAVSPERGGDRDPAPGQLCPLRDACRGDRHAVCHAPVLCRVPDVHRDVAPQTVIVSERCVCQGDVTAAQHDRRTGLGAHRGRGEADDSPGGRERLVAPWPLGPTGLAVSLPGRLLEGRPREGVVSHRGARRATGTAPRRGPRRGEGQRRRAPPRRHAVSAALARHLPGVVVATGPLQPQGGPRESGGDQVEQGGEPRGAPPQGRGERGGRLGGGWLPCGRPGRRVVCAPVAGVAAALAWRAAVAASLRTPCSRRLGHDRRCGPLTRESGKTARPGTGWPYQREKPRSRPWVCGPAVVTRTASPAMPEGSAGQGPGCRKHPHNSIAHGRTGEHKRWTGR